MARGKRLARRPWFQPLYLLALKARHSRRAQGLNLELPERQRLYPAHHERIHASAGGALA